MHVSYQIDSADEIVVVGGEWDEFARSNEAPELSGNAVLGRKLWDFVTDATTREIYSQFVERARRGERLQFDIRCDAPDVVRLLTVRISLAADSRVEFATDLLQSETRERQHLLDRFAERTDELLYSCSWCGRVRFADNEWMDLNMAVQCLGLFQRPAVPQLSHGMCPDCYSRVIGGDTRMPPLAESMP